jgi:hypothetical protein
VNAKAADSALVSAFAFRARAGLPCGEDFLAEQFLAAHPEFAWQRPLLHDMKGNLWSEFKTGEHSFSQASRKAQSAQ